MQHTPQIRRGKPLSPTQEVMKGDGRQKVAMAWDLGWVLASAVREESENSPLPCVTLKFPGL